MQVQLLPVLHHKTALFCLSEHAVKFQKLSLNIFDAVSIILKSGNHIENICEAGRSVSKDLGVKFEELSRKEQLSLSTMAMNLQAYREAFRTESEESHITSSEYSLQFHNLPHSKIFKLGKWDLRQALNSIKDNTYSEKFASQHNSLSQLCSLVELALIACKGGLNYAYSVLSAVDTDWMTFNNVQYLMGVGMGFAREHSGDQKEITALQLSFEDVFFSQLKILKTYSQIYPKANGDNRILNLMITCLDKLNSNFINITPQQYITAASYATAAARSPGNENHLIETAINAYKSYKQHAFLHTNKQTSFIYNSLTELHVACTHFLTHLPGTHDEKHMLLRMTIEPLFKVAVDANLGTGHTMSNRIDSMFDSIEDPKYYIKRTDHLGKTHTRISYAH